jgi:putative transposase
VRAVRWVEVPEARQLAGLGKSLSRAAQTRLRWMLFYFFNGRNVRRTCRHFGISRQTFYRWKRRFSRHDLTTLEERSHRPHKVRKPTWAAELAERVLSLRKQYPRWGKDKLVVLLRRERRSVSTSMVGRILADRKRRGALHEPPKPAVLRQARRKLRNRPWAIRKPKHWRIEQPGDLVEIDTKEIRMRGGAILKHFSARDVVSRWDVVEVHRRATSLAAARFLDTCWIACRFPSKRCRWMEAVSSPQSSRRLASKKSCRCSCCPPNHRSSTPMWSGRTALITRSSTRCTRSPIRCLC